MNTTPEPGNLRADLFRAIHDPGAYLERLPGETVPGWQHRAVMAVLRDHGITEEERPRLRAVDEDGDDDEEPVPAEWHPGECFTCHGNVTHDGVFHSPPEILVPAAAFYTAHVEGAL